MMHPLSLAKETSFSEKPPSGPTNKFKVEDLKSKVEIEFPEISNKTVLLESVDSSASLNSIGSDRVGNVVLPDCSEASSIIFSRRALLKPVFTVLSVSSGTIFEIPISVAF